MVKGKFDCRNYGDEPIREELLYCIDCEEETVQQLAYYNGNKDDKVKFCTRCGKTYSYNFAEFVTLDSSSAAYINPFDLLESKKYYEKDNIIIFNEDNLEVLRNLEGGSINLIYCDILYNTGKVFDDYNDDLGTPQEAMEWYRPRIEEMKRVLSENGSIYIHCNWRLDSYMRILMDEIFGVRSFRNRIYRKHSQERGFYKNYDSQVDIILYYVKNPDDFIFNDIIDGKPKLFPIVENGLVEGRSESINYKDFYYFPASETKHWIMSENRIKEMIDNNEIIMVDGLPCRKTYAIPMGNLWDDDGMLDTYKRNRKDMAYDTPKPDAVLERIIAVSSNIGDTVADFFMGGGTTAVITKRMGRQGVFCDISAKSCKVAIGKLEKEVINNE